MSSLKNVEVLVIGAGRAAASFVDELQRAGFAGSILMANEESQPPYDRPPLSKDVLRGAATLASVQILAPSALSSSNLQVLHGVSVVQLDRACKTARLSNGQTVQWGKLLIATGGRARQDDSLPARDGFYYLRTFADAQRLQSALKPGRSVTVFGGGFLGLEIASTASGMGLAASVVEQGMLLLPRLVPPQLSAWLARRLQREGVTLHTGDSIASHVVEGVRHHVRTARGRLLESDVVVACIGQTPEVTIARQCGLDIDPHTGGVLTDSQGRTSDANIFAAGDCASSHSEFLGAVTRNESWQSAEWQGRRAARGLLGLPVGASPVPWFWTDMAGINLQVLGALHPELQWVERHAADSLPDADKFILMGLAGRRLRYAAAVNAGGDLRALTPLIESGRDCDPAVLADSSLPLRRIVKAQLEAAIAIQI